MSERRRAAFLDRDGVLNASVVVDGRPHPPSSAGEVSMLPGAVDACARLVEHGWLLVVITNQPDIARGTTTRAEVDAVNRRVLDGLDVTELVVCPHDDVDRCRCRKPEPGMILDAADRWGIDLAGSITVGDRWRDVEAGRRAGTATVFVDHGYDERRPDAPDRTVASLAEAVDLLVAGLLLAGPEVR